MQGLKIFFKPKMPKTPSLRYKLRGNHTMIYISSDKQINDFCNALLKSGHWKYYRGGKHPILRHMAIGATKFFIVPCTPSDPRAFANFRRDYNRYIRTFLIQTGVILA